MKSPNWASQMGSRLGLAQLIPTSKPTVSGIPKAETYLALPFRSMNLPSQLSEP